MIMSELSRSTVLHEAKTPDTMFGSSLSLFVWLDSWHVVAYKTAVGWL